MPRSLSWSKRCERAAGRINRHLAGESFLTFSCNHVDTICSTRIPCLAANAWSKVGKSLVPEAAEHQGWTRPTMSSRAGGIFHRMDIGEFYEFLRRMGNRELLNPITAKDCMDAEEQVGMNVVTYLAHPILQF